MEIPAPIQELAEDLLGEPGVAAVVVGGSRATGQADEHSDWDLGLYYEGVPAFEALARRGQLHPPGSWGRLMNGGAWLDLDGGRVDVLLRDVDVVRHWTEEAQAGRYEVDGLLGYLAGIPTYSLAAECALARPLVGTPPPTVPFPEALAAAAPGRWRFHRDFSLHHAAAHAARADVAAAIGHAARATLEEAHARLCEQRRWHLNDKRLVASAGLTSAAHRLARAGGSPKELTDTIAEVGALLRS